MTNRELDALVAEKIFKVGTFENEHGIFIIDRTNKDKIRTLPVPLYSTEIYDAWKVVEKMKSEGLNSCFASTKKGYAAYFTKSDTIDASSDYYESMPLAITRSALKAVGVEI